MVAKTEQYVKETLIYHCELFLQADKLWLSYGKSLKSLDSCKRQFTASLNRSAVFKAVITRTLEPPADSAGHDAVNSCLCDRRVSVLLNCPELVGDDLSVITATRLRQLLVTQHIYALLTHCRSVTDVKG